MNPLIKSWTTEGKPRDLMTRISDNLVLLKMYLELRAYLGGQTFDRSIDFFINDFEDGMREFWGVEVDDEADIIQDKRQTRPNLLYAFQVSEEDQTVH